jgi:hypothetical protein
LQSTSATLLPMDKSLKTPKQLHTPYIDYDMRPIRPLQKEKLIQKLEEYDPIIESPPSPSQPTPTTTTTTTKKSVQSHQKPKTFSRSIHR